MGPPGKAGPGGGPGPLGSHGPRGMTVQGRIVGVSRLFLVISVETPGCLEQTHIRSFSNGMFSGLKGPPGARGEKGEVGKPGRQVMHPLHSPASNGTLLKYHVIS